MLKSICILLNMTAILWGIVIILPFGTFPAFPALYQYMSALLSESAWGVLFMGTGIVGIVGQLSQEAFTIKIAAFAAMFCWLCVCLSILLVSPLNVGVPAYFGLAAMNAYVGFSTKLK